jgi:hypothetical protein
MFDMHCRFSDLPGWMLINLESTRAPEIAPVFGELGQTMVDLYLSRRNLLD